MRLRLSEIQQCVADLKAFDPQTVNSRYGEPEVERIQAAIEDALSQAFGHGTPTYNRFSGAATLDQGPHVMQFSGGWSGEEINYDAQNRADARKYLAEGIPRSVALLEGAIRALQNRLKEHDIVSPPETPKSKAAYSRSVFIVHGHDGEAREAVARFLENIDFEPIILQEKANQGLTVIEKIEAHAEVGFAVVLLTPDDLGMAKLDAELEPRARQNVLIELGYFIAKLGRARVCAFAKGDVKVPSDFAGVIWTPFDSTGGWKIALAKELAAANYKLDWNKVMG